MSMMQKTQTYMYDDLIQRIMDSKI